MLIPAAQADSVLRSAVVLDLGDIAAMGEQLKAQARAEAERIVEEARAERQRLIAGAAEEGRREGRAEGLEAGRAEGRREAAAQAAEQAAQQLEHLRAGFESALSDFEQSREQMLREARADLLRLAMAIARRVTRRAIAIDPAAAAAQLEAALEHVAAGSTLRIEVSSAEREAALQAIPEIGRRAAGSAHVDVVARDDLAPGDVIVTTPGGARIDGRIDLQLDRLAAELMPGDPEERDGDLPG
ncbi:MAG: FliH/SctL family protein [Phycisphaerales bacterium JB039]